MKTKKILLFILFQLFVYNLFAKNISNVFLLNFFDTANYDIVEYKNKSDTFYFAFISEDKNDIFQKAILFKNNGNTFEPFLFFNKNEIFNSNSKLFSAKIETQTFYGWKLKYTEKNNTVFISTSFYTDKGFHVTDGISLKLVNNIFEKTVISKSEY